MHIRHRNTVPPGSLTPMLLMLASFVVFLSTVGMT
jgi:hypothetical protein